VEGVGASRVWQVTLGTLSLLGLLLMHGFGGHAVHAAQSHTAHPAHDATGLALASMDPGTDAGHAVEEPGCPGGCTEVASTPLPTQAPSQHGLLVLCATVLLALTALLAPGSRQSRLAMLQPPRPTRACPPGRARRGTGPPDLHALSVLRC
jgi:hypothetical protein